MKREPHIRNAGGVRFGAALVDAAKRTHEAGYSKIDAYSPFPIEGLAEEIGFHHDEVPLVVLIGGIIGGSPAIVMQYWMSAVDYPLNIGGKPSHSWPAFIVITFEMTILFAGISAVFGMLALNGLAHAVSPGIQCAALRAGLERPLLSDRVFLRPEIRPTRHAPFSGEPAPALAFGGAQLTCCDSVKFRRIIFGCLVKSRVPHSCAFCAQEWDSTNA